MADDGLLAKRYRRLRTIGTGGMARVVLAEDQRLGRQVAIKRLHADSPGETAKRFEREARLGASLNHQNIVAIYDVDCDTDDVLIVMEYVEGETLKQALERGPLEPSEAVRVLRDIAAALDHAHAEGVVHRDVKPANILLRRDGVAKLADLGIARAAEATEITRSGFVVGTAAYMAPEQLGGEAAGPAADVYALAAVAYEALSGQRARGGTNAVEIATEAVKAAPPDLRDAWPEAPARAAEVIERGLALLPEDRPASAGELAAELEAGLDPRNADEDDTEVTQAMPVTRREPVPVVRREPIMPRRSPPPPRAAPPVAAAAPVQSRRRGLPGWLPIAALAALVLLGVLTAVLLSGGDGAGDRASGSGQADSPRLDPKPEREPKETDGQTTTPAPAQDTTPTETAPEEPAQEEPANPRVAVDPAQGTRLDAQAFGLIRQGQYAEAVPIARQAVASFPETSTEMNYAFALYNLGTALNRSGNPGEAIPYLEKRLEISNFKTDVVQAELDKARAAAG